MCGIVGVISTGPAEEYVSRVEEALHVQHHRGPDDTTLWTTAGCVLGHNRLSIIDLDCGRQPMSTPEGDLTIVFNGEIYNYLELRHRLEALGHVFRTHSDTETILYAYREWRHGCVHHFNGMWAFAIWDERSSELFLSRDRFGVKPLCFAESGGAFFFASESKALLAMDRSLAQPDNAQIYRFLRTGLAHESANTFYSDVKLLPGGHMALVKAGQPVRIERYYDVVSGVMNHPEVGNDAHEHLRSLLEDSVRLRLRSDVPVGSCLSGGLDSSAIVGLATGLRGPGIHTFTSIFPGTELNEQNFAEAVIDRFKATPMFVEPRLENFMDTIPRITWHQDAPTSAMGLYSQWHVMQLASQRVRVLLDGQGADEILAGYPGFIPDYISSLMMDCLHVDIAACGKLRRELPDLAAAYGGNPLTATVLTRLPVSLRRVGRGLLGDTEIISQDFRDAMRAGETAPVLPKRLPNLLDSSLLESLTRTSVPALLHYEDRNSMAFSIEARTPFLDYRVVEFCLALPYAEKIEGWRTKAVLRRSMKDFLPDVITERRDKQGFPAPLRLWLTGGLMGPVKEILTSAEARSRGITDATAVRRILDEHKRGVADHHGKIWRLLTLELWYRNFIDGFGPVTL